MREKVWNGDGAPRRKRWLDRYNASADPSCYTNPTRLLILTAVPHDGQVCLYRESRNLQESSMSTENLGSTKGGISREGWDG